MEIIILVLVVAILGVAGATLGLVGYLVSTRGE